MKPRPCVGCGYCCKKAPCIMGARIHGPVSPCPSLVEKDGRYWCGLVLMAEGSDKRHLEHWLFIGEGCSSAMNTDRQRMVERENP